MKTFVAYYRVSTKRQGRSGLGLDAQRKAVLDFINGGIGKVIKSFTEVESGKKSDNERPQLAKAMACARRAGAVLVVAKLDRLSRNVAFLSRLMESGVDFVAVDNPHANKFTVHILAAVAEWEREQISRRTKEGLAMAKQRGVKLGSARPGHWTGREDKRLKGLAKGRKLAAQAISAKARREYADLKPEIEAMREQGLSLRRIAKALNEAGHRTRRNCSFTAAQVQRILSY